MQSSQQGASGKNGPSEKYLPIDVVHMYTNMYMASMGLPSTMFLWPLETMNETECTDTSGSEYSHYHRTITLQSGAYDHVALTDTNDTGCGSIGLLIEDVSLVGGPIKDLDDRKERRAATLLISLSLFLITFCIFYALTSKL